MPDYALRHAVKRLKEDGKLQIWGANAYKSFKRFAKDKIMYNCRKQGPNCYHITFERVINSNPGNENPCESCEHRECFDCPVKLNLFFTD